MMACQRYYVDRLSVALVLEGNAVGCPLIDDCESEVLMNEDDQIVRVGECLLSRFVCMSLDMPTAECLPPGTEQ